MDPLLRFRKAGKSDHNSLSCSDISGLVFLATDLTIASQNSVKAGLSHGRRSERTQAERGRQGANEPGEEQARDRRPARLVNVLVPSLESG